jgi:hypothetical protein
VATRFGHLLVKPPSSPFVQLFFATTTRWLVNIARHRPRGACERLSAAGTSERGEGQS